MSVATSGNELNAYPGFRCAPSGLRLFLCPSSLRGAKRRSNPFFLHGSMDRFAALTMTVKSSNPSHPVMHRIIGITDLLAAIEGGAVVGVSGNPSLRRRGRSGLEMKM